MRENIRCIARVHRKRNVHTLEKGRDDSVDDENDNLKKWNQIYCKGVWTRRQHAVSGNCRKSKTKTKMKN